MNITLDILTSLHVFLSRKHEYLDKKLTKVNALLLDISQLINQSKEKDELDRELIEKAIGISQQIIFEYDSCPNLLNNFVSDIAEVVRAVSIKLLV